MALIHILIHGRHLGCFFLLRFFSHHGLGGQHQPCNGIGTLKGKTNDLGRIDDPCSC
ncbi:hypothetical protein ACFL03_06340 [Thermodesulfobacteriota bacterium]